MTRSARTGGASRPPRRPTPPRSAPAAGRDSDAAGDARSSCRKIRLVAGGSIGAGVCHTAVQYFADIPARLAGHLDLAALLVFLAVGLYLLQLLVPREFRVTLEWRRR
jgi:hypothetical protein